MTIEPQSSCGIDRQRVESRPSNGRRRLLRSAGPVLMTLASRPVLGSVSCTTGSAFTSINASGVAATQICTGRSPAYWAASSTHWTSYTKNGSGASLFIPPPPGGATGLVAGSTGSVFTGKSMLDVLGLGDSGGDQSLAVYTAAALLNASAGMNLQVLSATTVRDMWNSYVSAGSYQPTTGVQWYAAQIVTYLKSTMNFP